MSLEDLAERVWSLECYLKGSNIALGQLTMQTVRTAAAGQFYGKLAVKYLMDIATFLVTHELADQETKKRKRFELIKSVGSISSVFCTSRSSTERQANASSLPETPISGGMSLEYSPGY